MPLLDSVRSLPGLVVTGPPARLRTLSSNGIKHLRVRLGV